jgi:hypothetical protein
MRCLSAGRKSEYFSSFIWLNLYLLLSDGVGQFVKPNGVIASAKSYLTPLEALL